MSVSSNQYERDVRLLFFLAGVAVTLLTTGAINIAGWLDSLNPQSHQCPIPINYTCADKNQSLEMDCEVNCY